MILRKAIMQNWMKKRIILQVQYIKRNKMKIIQEFQKEEKNHIDIHPEQLLNNYIDRLTQYSLNGMQFKDFPSLPFVMIDSRVALNVANQDPQLITICLPNYENEEIGFFSYQSPLGQQLLLKQVGDRVSLGDGFPFEEISIQHIEFSSLGNY
ncbi:GreA/GreB family elongation factor [Alkalihalobacterium elongatum]|uniref:GreA/GreB family elongation factor n=1 Tax=Alkalihalobacterium elongatum TaxID=2675466 RepID=UPI001C1F908C|nr:GreA/GreB family elongation factor [Alkalihalobacterium elongatum]